MAAVESLGAVMRALTLAAAAIVISAAASSPSHAITFSVGSLAATCYSASLNYNVMAADLDA